MFESKGGKTKTQEIQQFNPLKQEDIYIYIERDIRVYIRPQKKLSFARPFKNDAVSWIRGSFPPFLLGGSRATERTNRDPQFSAQRIS